MPTVSFYTLGCRLNFADTGAVQDEFSERGYTIVPFGQASDVTVINSCSVTEEADRKCRQIARRAHRANPAGFVIVTGCYAQLRPDQLSEIDGVDAVVGTAEKFRIFEVLPSFTRGATTQIAVSCIDEPIPFGPAASGRERTRAFLKIQDGCDYQCAFCTIPQARGASRSHDPSAIVEQAKQLAAAGFAEVVLSGVNIGLYQHGDYTLIDVLRRLDRETSVQRFRISSVEPNLLTDEIVDFVAGSRAFMRHFHIPLQSGDDEILGRMRRRYRRDLYADRVAHIRSRLPTAAIGADVIVGHPGESDKHFEATRQFIRSLPVSYLHVFPFSERRGTVAANAGDGVAPEVRKSRCKALRALSAEKAASFLQLNGGRRSTVVWEEGRDGGLLGYTENFIRLRRAELDESLIGQIERVVVGVDGVATPLGAATTV